MYRAQKAFSLFEIIVVIFVIAVLGVIASIKLSSLIDNSIQLKIKSDVFNIKSSIELLHNKNVLYKGDTSFLEKLDDCIPMQNKCNLFSGINGEILLKQPILSCSNTQNESYCWQKISNQKYQIINKQNIVLSFIYSQTNGSLECDENNELCKKVTQ